MTVIYVMDKKENDIMVKNVINLTNKDDIKSIYEVADSILKDNSDIDRATCKFNPKK